MPSFAQCSCNVISKFGPTSKVKGRGVVSEPRSADKISGYKCHVQNTVFFNICYLIYKQLTWLSVSNHWNARCCPAWVRPACRSCFLLVGGRMACSWQITVDNEEECVCLFDETKGDLNLVLLISVILYFHQYCICILNLPICFLFKYITTHIGSLVFSVEQVHSIFYILCACSMSLSPSTKVRQSTVIVYSIYQMQYSSLTLREERGEGC